MPVQRGRLQGGTPRWASALPGVKGGHRGSHLPGVLARGVWGSRVCVGERRDGRVHRLVREGG